MFKRLVKSISFVMVIALLAACAPGTTQPTPSPTSENTSAAEAGNSIAEAMMSGASLSCQITHPDRGDSIAYLIKGQKMKVTSVVSNNENQNSNMINDGQYIYIWTDGEDTGFKAEVPSEEDLENVQQSYPQQLPDFSQAEVQNEYEDNGYTINCTPTSLNDTEFVPPTTVTFQDMSALLQNAMDGMKSMDKAPQPGE